VAITGGMLACALVLVAMLAPLTRRGSLRTRLVFDLAHWRCPAAVGMWVIIGAFLVLPLGSLAWKAGMEVIDLPTGRARKWSATKCMSMVALSPRIDRGQIRFRHRREIGWS